MCGKQFCPPIEANIKVQVVASGCFFGSLLFQVRLNLFKAVWFNLSSVTGLTELVAHKLPIASIFNEIGLDKSRNRKRDWGQYGAWVVVTERGHGGSRDRKRGWIVGMLKAEQQRRLLKRRKSHACQPVLPCTGFFVLFCFISEDIYFSQTFFFGARGKMIG